METEAAEPDEGCVERLLRGYRIYDENVDVVSAFDGLFASPTLEPTVGHFERFPRIAQDDGGTLTPDFTVVFNDGTGLVGEISRLALNDESLVSLARQTANYERVTALPVGDGKAEPVSHLDVLLVMPADVAVAAFHRLEKAAADPDHPYSPDRPPCLVHYSLMDNKYVFIRHADPGNGRLREDGRPTDEEGRPVAIGSWLDRSSINVPSALFVPAKVRNAFMNDPVDALYLAAHLWQKEFAEKAGDARNRTRIKIEVSEREVARTLRQRYGTVRRADVSQAMQLLVRAGLAERTAHRDRWAVAFHEIARGRTEDVHIALAKRVCGRRRVRELRRMAEPELPPSTRLGPQQDSLLDRG